MANLKHMYKGLINSPFSALLEGISESDTYIHLESVSHVPTPPNQLVIGFDSATAETVLVTDVDVNENIITVERGFQGESRPWGEGTLIGRIFTEYDYQTLIDNITILNDNKTEKASHAVVLRADGWTDEAPYTQNVTVPGLKADSTIVVETDISSQEELVEISCINMYKSESGNMKVTCYYSKPEIDITLEVTEVI